MQKYTIIVVLYETMCGYFGSGTDSISLLILFLVGGGRSSKNHTALSFQIGSDEIWQDCCPTYRNVFHSRY